MLELHDINMVVKKHTGHYINVLNNISINIKEGECVFLWGPNGSGKSSLQEAIAVGNSSYIDDNTDSVINKVVEGSIKIKGKEINYMHPYQRSFFISRVTQNPLDMFSNSLTLEENFALAYKRNQQRSFLKKAVTDRLRKYFVEKIEKQGMDIENRLTDNITSFSGGELQILAFLAATICIPDLLLLDEHTRDLDTANSIKMEQLTNKFIKEHNVTLVWVTHNPNQVVQYGNRIFFMRSGSIIKEITPDEKKTIPDSELIKLLKSFQQEN